MGSNPLVKRLLTGAFNLRPPTPRYSQTWDVTIVLNHIRSLGPDIDLSTKNLTMKLVTLIALISGQRCQTIALINLDYANVTATGVTFVIDKLTKTSKVCKPHVDVSFTSYPHDALLCVINVLRTYLQRTKPVRGTERRLFLSYVQPYKAVGSETIGRWIKGTLKAAGINTDKFTAHSTRSAACSTAFKYGVSLDTIMKTAGWSKCSTFAKYYNKSIITNPAFANAVLGKNQP